MAIPKCLLEGMRKTNFYANMFAENERKSDEKPSADGAVVQDEAIGKPWTKKYIVYVNEPAEGFAESLKAMAGVVAVYEKDKQDAPKPAAPNV